MLIEAPLKDGDTVTIKTFNGDELVARLVETKTNTYVVSKPLAIMATAQGLGLGPYTFTVNPDTKIEINKNAVIFIAKTDSEMAKQYISSTSGIKLV
jgi:anaerobic selenocysteine-containing dehydrogenase